MSLRQGRLLVLGFRIKNVPLNLGDKHLLARILLSVRTATIKNINRGRRPLGGLLVPDHVP